MRNWPRYSRGSLEAEEITRPRWKKIFFSTAFLVTMSVPVFWPRLSHWSKSPGSMVLRCPLTAILEGVNYRGVVSSQLTVDGDQLPTVNRQLRTMMSPMSDKPYFDQDDLAARHFDSAKDLGEPGKFPF